jgi:hypothetical protein
LLGNYLRIFKIFVKKFNKQASCLTGFFFAYPPLVLPGKRILKTRGGGFGKAGR